MKKKFLLPLLFIPFLLTGCGQTQQQQQPETPATREQIQLTTNNFSKYIAVYTISDTYAGSSTYTLYRYRLEGSCLCKFNNCTITYCYADYKGNCEDTQNTINLTMSGCGETKEVQVSYYQGAKEKSKYFFHLVSASGTVELLY